jgi:SAM-dependent methyltransferase
MAKRILERLPRRRTRSGGAPDEGAERLAIFRSVLAPMRPGRLVDLGTGHGKFALAAAELGWSVTAVDARSERLPGAAGIEWVEADVREFPLEGYDCVSILGLLYHLEVDDQLDLLRRAAGTTTIVDTHVALGATHRERGYDGRTFGEELEAATASWGNPTSFWPTEESLIRQFHDAGFARVWKHVPEYRADRTFWVCS